MTDEQIRQEIREGMVQIQNKRRIHYPEDASKCPAIYCPSTEFAFEITGEILSLLHSKGVVIISQHNNKDAWWSPVIPLIKGGE